MTAGPLPLNRAPWRRLSPSQKWHRAVRAVEQSGLLPIVSANVEFNNGRPLQFSARALLIGLALHGIECALSGRDMVLTQAVDTLADIHPAKQRDLGIIDETSYRKFWHRFTLLATTIETAGLSVPGEDRRMDIHEVVSRVIDASIPPTYTARPFIAIDGTDFETWARRRSWGKTPALDPGRELPDDIETVPKGAVSESGWPRTAPDGKPLHTKDPDAREGHRSGKNGRPGNIYTGYEAHLATQIPAVGEDADGVPHIVLGMHLVPASSHRGTAAVNLVDSVLARGREIREIAADRGYTPCKPESFVWPLWQRDIDVIGDLHPNQRGTAPGPKPGMIWLDGGLYSAALPSGLRDLPGFKRNMPADEEAKLRARYDKRVPYAFTPHSARDKDGYQRLKGPAVAGKVRCPNVPRSMRLSHARPTTACTPGKPCGCGLTVTVAPTDHPRERQRTVWNSTAWAQDYHRRNAIESTNAELKTHRMRLERGFTRVFGTVKNNLLLAFALLGYNLVKLRHWHALRYLPDPWAQFLDEPDTTPAPPKPTRVRARRRANVLGDPPG